jgi:hypothetical protein
VVVEGEHGVVSDPGQTVVGGRYRLHTLIASGGMGRVWHARDQLLDREVAVKELVTPAWLPSAGRGAEQLSSLREARAAARLGHPGVIQIFDVVQTAGRSWIVMEYVRSRSLHDVVAQDGPLAHREAARVGLAVLSALRTAHAAGVLHRDVKPHNVLVGTDGRVVLTDFGLATLGVPPGAGGTTTGPLIGSPSYVAPELIRDGVGDVRTDLWSLGATLYAAVEGRPPFARPTVAESLAAVMREAPDAPRRPGPLHDVIAGLLTTDPARRFTAAEAQTALHAVARRAVGVVAVPAPRRPADGAVRFRPAAVPPMEPAPEAMPEPMGPGRRRGAGRTRVALAGAALAAVAVAGVVVWGPGGGDGPGASPPGAVAAPVATAPCAGATPEALPEASVAAPYALPEGWRWHVDIAGFQLPVPRGWTRAAGAGAVCFRDAEGGRAFVVEPGPPTAGQPLRHWQTAERRALAEGTLPGYRKVSMGVLLVPGGGADWEYTWQPPAQPRLHAHRVLLPAGAAKAYQLSWTTPDPDWALNLDQERTFRDGFRDSVAARSTWAVPPPRTP